jgi:hypothetical protein
MQAGDLPWRAMVGRFASHFSANLARASGGREGFAGPDLTEKIGIEQFFWEKAVTTAAE